MYRTLFFILIVFDIYLLDFYFNVYLLYVAYVNYIIKQIWYGMVWYGSGFCLSEGFLYIGL